MHRTTISLLYNYCWPNLTKIPFAWAGLPKKRYPGIPVVSDNRTRRWVRRHIYLFCQPFPAVRFYILSAPFITLFRGLLADGQNAAAAAAVRIRQINLPKRFSVLYYFAGTVFITCTRYYPNFRYRRDEKSKSAFMPRFWVHV